MNIYIPLLFIVAAVLLYISVRVFYRIFRRGKLDWHIPSSQFLQLREGRIHYVQSGKGPHVLLLHGIGASIFTWRFLIPRLARKYTVTAIDLPGFGKSFIFPYLDYGVEAQANRIINILEKLNIRECRLVGSSMGGAIALWLAQRRSDLFPKIACMAPAADPKLVPKAIRHLSRFSPLLVPAVRYTTVALILGRVVTRAELINRDSIECYLSPYKGNKDAILVFLNATQVIDDPRIPKLLPKIEKHVLILWGKNDKIVTRKFINRTHRLLLNVQLEIHPTAGHHLMEDEPDWAHTHLHNYFAEVADVVALNSPNSNIC